MKLGHSNYENEYRHIQLEVSRMYQDLVADVLIQQLKLVVCFYSSRYYQFGVGESASGVEVKYDKRYVTTGNLYIETGEKARPRSGDYAKSGIRRNDNTWLYVIGDLDTLFLFGKKVLVSLFESRKYREVENATRTSVGYLLPREDAFRYCEKSLLLKVSESVRKQFVELDMRADKAFQRLSARDIPKQVNKSVALSSQSIADEYDGVREWD